MCCGLFIRLRTTYWYTDRLLLSILYLQNTIESGYYRVERSCSTSRLAAGSRKGIDQYMVLYEQIGYFFHYSHLQYTIDSHFSLYQFTEYLRAHLLEMAFTDKRYR